ncbi:hypothetical protein SK128_021519 [Halocaridina rubra]|uniref:Uncharacterized protein n=1 Tax=Halocaridina rubra TaxID=373956 RepID=A0AAN8XDQ7_HALRR
MTHVYITDKADNLVSSNIVTDIYNDRTEWTNGHSPSQKYIGKAGIPHYLLIRKSNNLLGLHALKNLWRVCRANLSHIGNRSRNTLPSKDIF